MSCKLCSYIRNSCALCLCFMTPGQICVRNCSCFETKINLAMANVRAQNTRKSRAQRSLILTQQKGATSGWLKRARFQGECWKRGLPVFAWLDSKMRVRAQLKRVRVTGKGKKGKGKLTKGSVAASAPEKAAADFEGKPGQEAGPVEGLATESISAETSSASKKILFGVHDITGLLVEAQVSAACYLLFQRSRLCCEASS